MQHLVNLLRSIKHNVIMIFSIITLSNMALDCCEWFLLWIMLKLLYIIFQ